MKRTSGLLASRSGSSAGFPFGVFGTASGAVFGAVLVLATVLLTNCSSAPPAPPELDERARENAIFNCKQKIQAKKKARFALLPPILKRLAGDNQVLKQFDAPPSKGDISRTIWRFPLAGDSGGMWRNAPDAHLRTVSTRFEVPRATSRVPQPPEFVSMVFGQPGRVYSFPLSQLKSSPSSISGTSKDDALRIRAIDEHHLLITATTKTPSAKAKATSKTVSASNEHGAEETESQTLFYPQNIYALVRTYVDQSYDEETASQLSDYPVYSSELNDDTCDQQVNAPPTAE